MSPASSLPTLKVTNRIRPLTDDNGATASMSKSSRPKAQSDKSNSRNKDNQEAMEAAIDEWMSHANAKAHELAQRFDKKPRYFLDRFFQGGQKFIHKHTVTNAFNAFKSIKAAELRAGMFTVTIKCRTTDISHRGRKGECHPNYKPVPRRVQCPFRAGARSVCQ